ncbi:MAG: peptidyl-prolyl cis-trans isomerase [Candidatus Sumerlaeaceae bacterium]|nr:peptidyl-prolyl cis-trans isomerase [Candidatus Sumerlaeaceae bacterium]
MNELDKQQTHEPPVPPEGRSAVSFNIILFAVSFVICAVVALVFVDHGSAPAPQAGLAPSGPATTVPRPRSTATVLAATPVPRAAGRADAELVQPSPAANVDADVVDAHPVADSSSSGEAARPVARQANSPMASNADLPVEMPGVDVTPASRAVGGTPPPGGGLAISKGHATTGASGGTMAPISAPDGIAPAPGMAPSAATPKPSALREASNIPTRLIQTPFPILTNGPPPASRATAAYGTGGPAPTDLGKKWTPSPLTQDPKSIAKRMMDSAYKDGGIGLRVTPKPSPQMTAPTPMPTDTTGLPAPTPISGAAEIAPSILYTPEPAPALVETPAPPVATEIPAPEVTPVATPPVATPVPSPTPGKVDAKTKFEQILKKQGLTPGPATSAPIAAAPLLGANSPQSAKPVALKGMSNAPGSAQTTNADGAAPVPTPNFQTGMEDKPGGLRDRLKAESLPPEIARRLNKLPNSTAASVGDRVLTQREASRLAEASFALLGRQPSADERPMLEEQTAREWAERVAIATEARRQGLKVSDDEVRKFIAEQKERTGPGIEEALQKSGFTEKEILENMRDSALADKMVDTVFERQFGTDEKLKAAYDAEPGLYQPSRRLHLQAVFRPRPKSEAEARAVQQDMERVAQEAGRGEDFAALAKKEGAQSAGDENGDLGWVDASDRLQPEVAAALGDLKPGQVSRVLSSVDGFRVIKLVEVQEPKPGFEGARENVIATVRSVLRLACLDQALANTVVKVGDEIQAPDGVKKPGKSTASRRDSASRRSSRNAGNEGARRNSRATASSNSKAAQDDNLNQTFGSAITPNSSQPIR